jgi:hypothetical protein
MRKYLIQYLHITHRQTLPEDNYFIVTDSLIIRALIDSSKSIGYECGKTSGIISWYPRTTQVLNRVSLHIVGFSNTKISFYQN